MRPRPMTHDALAELRRGAADALQRDRADRGRRGVLQTRSPPARGTPDCAAR